MCKYLLLQCHPCPKHMIFFLVLNYTVLCPSSFCWLQWPTLYRCWSTKIQISHPLSSLSLY
jgi:hypothetical protein